MGRFKFHEFIRPNQIRLGKLLTYILNPNLHMSLHESQVISTFEELCVWRRKSKNNEVKDPLINFDGFIYPL